MSKIIVLVSLLFLGVGCSFEERTFIAEEEIDSTEEMAPSAVVSSDGTTPSVIASSKKQKASPAARQAFFIIIRNDTKVNLTLAIRRCHLDEKVLQSTPKVLPLLKEVLQELELNQKRNKDITLGRWKKRIEILADLCSPYLEEKDQKEIAAALASTIVLVGIPEKAKDADLLESEVVENLVHLCYGLEDTLQPYAYAAEQKKENQNVPEEKRAPAPQAKIEKELFTEEKLTKPVALSEIKPESQKPPTTPEVKSETKTSASPAPKEPESESIQKKLESQVKVDPNTKIEPNLKFDSESKGLQFEPNFKAQPNVKLTPDIKSAKIFGE